MASAAQRFDWQTTEAWSFDRWRSSPYLRPLSEETIEEMLDHVVVDRNWRKPVPGRGYCEAVLEAIQECERTGARATEGRLAEMAGCSRSSVSRWKRWLREHRYIDWRHVRALGERWARCVFVTTMTATLAELFAQGDALSVCTGRRPPGGGRNHARRAALLLEHALARSRIGNRNETCWVMCKLLRRAGADPGLARDTALRYASMVDVPRTRFTGREALKCFGSAYS